jgi:caa(3)-type oxidase subunit IV
MAHAASNAAPKPHYRQYWTIFALLAVLTAVEIGATYVPVHRHLIIATLVVLAIVKAALVGLFFMHLLHETMILRLTVTIPLALAGVYAIALIYEAGWRVAWRFMTSGRVLQALTS